MCLNRLSDELELIRFLVERIKRHFVVTSDLIVFLVHYGIDIHVHICASK